MIRYLLPALLIAAPAVAQQQTTNWQSQIDAAEATVTRTVTGMGNQIAADQNQIMQLQTDGQKATKERDDAKKSVDDLTKKVSDLTNDKASLEARAKDLQARIDELQKQVSPVVTSGDQSPTQSMTPLSAPGAYPHSHPEGGAR